MLGTGQVLWGKYRVTKLLGSGGFAEVYQAKKLTDGKRIAVKTERKHMDHPQTLEHEAAILSKLSEVEGVVKTLFVKKSGKKSFLGLELLGKSLFALRRSGELRPKAENMVRIAWQLLSILEKIHQRGIIHLDIKPDNILITRDRSRNIRLVDFGIAMDTKQQCLKRYQVLGNPLFCSARRLENRPVTQKDDLESWLYTMVFLTDMQLPWSSEARQKAAGWRDVVKELKESTSAEELCQSLPPEFVDIARYIRSIGIFDKPCHAFIKTALSSAAQRLHIDLNSSISLFKLDDSPTPTESQLCLSNTPTPIFNQNFLSCVKRSEWTELSNKSTAGEMDTIKGEKTECMPVLTASVKNYLMGADKSVCTPNRLKRRGSAYE